jgi:acetyl-CoA acetyltransferase
MTDQFELGAVVSGLGMSRVGRVLLADPWLLTAEAALNAITDAGLTPNEIDGIATYPGAMWSSPGITGAGCDDVRTMLGLKTTWHSGGGERPGQLGAIIDAVLAVHAGIANHVLCFRTVWESTAQHYLGGRSATVDNTAGGKVLPFGRELDQWTAPYGIGYPSHGALRMNRYMYESGITRKQFAQLAITSRDNAALNPNAIYREPMTVDDYLSSKMISDPLCLFDCDVPVDGSVAFVVSKRGTTDKSRAVSIQSIGSAPGVEESCSMMWSRTNLRVLDLDFAQVYDGFSIYALLWIEALGLCEKNGAGALLEDGIRISRNGDIPINTNGGQLSGGRLHGFGAFHEACLQLRGEAGARQIPNSPEIGAVTSGAERFSSALLLGAPN